MPEKRGQDVVHIKKYPNRRYYDPSRSCHLTLQDVHDLVVSGKDVSVTDSRTGDDITNVVLAQILLEKDQPKLDVFPTSLFHTMIRSNRQVLRGYTERFLGPFLGMVASSQRQFDSFLRQTIGSGFPNPLDWANGMMKAFNPAGAATASGETDAVPAASEGGGHAGEDGSDLDELGSLRAQLAELTARIEKLGHRARNGTPTADDRTGPV